MNLGDKKAFLFDMGGTLLEFNFSDIFDKNGCKHFQKSLEQTGVVVKNDVIRNFFELWQKKLKSRKTREVDVYELLQKFLPVKTLSRKVIFEVFKRYFLNYIDDIKPVPGAYELLSFLKKREKKVAILSNVILPGYIFKSILDFKGFKKLIDLYIFSFDIEYRKPAREFFEFSLNELKISNKECVMIGDNIYEDIKGAQSMGIYTIFLKKTSTFIGKQVKPDMIIESLHELRDYLQKEML